MALGLLAGATVLIPGMAAAASGTTATATTTTGTHQTVDIPTDNVLLALAADQSPSLGDVANIHQSATTSNSVSSSSNIGTNDALLALALDNGGSGFGARSLLLGSNGFGTLGTFGTFGSNPFLTTSSPFFTTGTFGVGDQSSSTTRSQSIDQTVSLNPDTVLAALALGHGSVSSLTGLGTFGSFGTFDNPFFGASGVGSIANIDRTVTQSASTNSNVDLNSSDVLAQLALGR